VQYLRNKSCKKWSIKTGVCVHERIKPFKCNTCEYENAWKCYLKQHIKSVHERIKPFNCNICNYKAAEKSTLKRHIRSIHE
jgi:KRAB domain-containing zinc finger protein